MICLGQEAEQDRGVSAQMWHQKPPKNGEGTEVTDLAEDAVSKNCLVRSTQHVINGTAHIIGGFSVEHFASAKSNMNKGWVFLDRQNAVMEVPGASDI